MSDQEWHQYHIGLLGCFNLERDGVTFSLTRACQRLIVYLALYGASSRTAVASALWPEAPEARAHGNFRSILWRIRSRAPELVDLRNGNAALTRGVVVDVNELVSGKLEILNHPDALDDETLADWLSVHELLPGWYDDWVLVKREFLRQLDLHALEIAADQLAKRGKYGSAVQAALSAVQLDPLRESAQRTLIRVFIAEGNVSDALRQYHSLVRLLRQELGLEPSGSTVRLVAGLLASDVPISLKQR